jgi:hypothetical protein
LFSLSQQQLGWRRSHGHKPVRLEVEEPRGLLELQGKRVPLAKPEQRGKRALQAKPGLRGKQAHPGLPVFQALRARQERPGMRRRTI